MITCLVCSGDMAHKKKGAKYCSAKCKYIAGRSAHKEYRIKNRKRLNDIARKYARKKYAANPEAARGYMRNWKSENKDKVIEERRKYAEKKGKTYDPDRKPGGYHRTIDVDKEYTKLAPINARQAWTFWMKHKAPDRWMVLYFKAAGRPWSNPRLSSGEKYKLRYNLDIEFNIKERLRRQKTKARKKDDIGCHIRAGLKSGGRSRSVEARLGYSIADLKAHIEIQFSKGMTWSKYFDGVIHIDHIIPQSSFNTAVDGEWLECWSLSNLRPMWGRDNIKKGARMEFLI